MELLVKAGLETPWKWEQRITNGIMATRHWVDNIYINFNATIVLDTSRSPLRFDDHSKELNNDYLNRYAQSAVLCSSPSLPPITSMSNTQENKQQWYHTRFPCFLTRDVHLSPCSMWVCPGLPSASRPILPNGLDRTCPTPTPSTTATGQAGDDDVEDRNDAGDDCLEDRADAVDNGHEASPNGLKDGLDLMEGKGVSSAGWFVVASYL